MLRDPRKERLSKAQIQYLDENVMTFIAWSGLIGLKVQPWQRRIVGALMRKDVITPDGRLTESGKAAYSRTVDRMTKRGRISIHPIRGNSASMVVIDDPEKPCA